MTIASRTVSRRALLAAGAAGAGALAGCGPPAPKVADRKAVLDEQLRLTLLAAVAGAANARERARTLRAAGATAATPAGPKGPQAAYDAERRALAGYVAAIGELGDRGSRDLLGGLVVDAAQSEAELARRLKRDPLPTAFPGQPA